MKIRRIRALFALTAFFVLATAGGHAQASVTNDQQSANDLVSQTAVAAAATQTGGIIGSQIGSNFGVSTNASLTNGPAVAYFDTRQIYGKAASSDGDPRFGIWINGTGSHIKSTESGGKYNGEIYTVVGGADYKVNDRVMVGLALGYENTDIDTTFNTGTFEGDGFTVAPYVGVKFGDKIVVDGSIGYSRVSYDTSRTNKTVTGSFDANRVFGTVNVTGKFQPKPHLRVNPSVGILGLYESQDSYTDSSGAAIAGTDIHLGRLKFGGEVGYRIGMFEPFALAYGEWDFNKNGPVFLNSTLGIKSKEGRVGDVLGLGVNLFFSDRVTGRIEGKTTQFRAGGDYKSYSGSAKLRIVF